MGGALFAADRLPGGGFGGSGDRLFQQGAASKGGRHIVGFSLPHNGTALMAQYIRQNGLAEKTGLTVRALSQSLLMSTAVAMKEDADSYYPVLRQGSGLANVDAAIRAQSYLMMNADATDSWADGKVKAEMGDDPEKTGVYTFSFTLNNLTDSQKQYMLSAELFTQGLRSDENGVVYMDTETVALNSHVTWTVDGVELEPAADLTGMDFNGDSLVNTDDVQAILDYVAGIRGELINARCADLNGDSLITTYDAYLLLNQLSTGLVTLPAEGQVQVQVKAALTEEQKDTLDANYPSGAYVQGYFFVDQLSTAEGAEGVTHSIPMVGFYGNWSEPSMFDKTSFVDAYYGDATVPYLGSTRINALSIKYPGDPTGYYFAGNPYFIEDTYPAERAAISEGSTLYQYQMSLIRNAGAVMGVVTNEEGQILYTGRVMDQVNAAFYYTSYGAWTDTAIAYPMNKKVSTLDVEEGDRITVTLAAVPEYYEQDGPLTANQIKKLMADGVLGQGAYLTSSMTIDNTAPQIFNISKDFVTGDLTVTAQDNQYISMVSLQDRSGNELTEALLPRQTEANERTSVTFDLDGVKIGQTCYIVVADYADNQTVYEVDYGGEPEDYSGRFFTFTSSTYRGSGQRWLEIEPEVLYYRNSSNHEGTKTAGTIDLEITAAEYVDGYVYMAADDGYLYVARQGLWDEYEPAGYFGDTFDQIYDMAYNYTDGKLYAMGNDSTVYSIGLIDGEFTKEFTVEIDHPSSSSSYRWLSRLAIDDEGNFYSVNNGPKSYTYLYKWTANDIVDGAVTELPYIGRVYHANYDYPGSLAWDHDNDILYFANAYSASGSSDCLLLKMDLQTGEGIKANETYSGEFDPDDYASRLQCSTAGLYIVPSASAGIEPVTEATRISLDITETTILRGQTITIRPTVYPWTLTDKSVVWESSDENVVQVVDGCVTGVGVGTATVTAATVAAPNLTAACEVTVEKLDTIHLKGLVYDKDGNPYWTEFTSDDPSAWTAVSEKTGSYMAGAIMEDTMYVHDGKEIFAVDADDFTTTSYGEIAASYIWSDATYAPATEEGLFGDFMALANGGTFLETVVAEEGEVDYWDLTDYFAEDPMAVIAYHTSGVSEYSTVLPSYVKYFDCPTQYYYMITESGLLHEISVLTHDDGYSYILNYEVIGQLNLDLSGVAAVTDGRYASMVYDEATGWLVISVCMGSSNTLYAVEPESFTIVNLGSFGDNGEKMVALYQHERASDLTVRLNKYEDTVYVGDTLRLTARVKPNAFGQNVTWSSSDTSVATVDENGVVTAIRDGTAIITATSVDTNAAGETASASCIVTVQALFALDTQVNAQIVTEDGTKWVTINTRDMSLQVNASAETTLTGAGMHDGKFYGTDSSYTAGGKIYMVDPENGYTQTAGADCPVGYAFLDVTQAPPLEYTKVGETYYAFDFPIYLANDQGFYFLRNYEESDFWGYGDSSYSDQGAMAYVGQIYEKSYGTQHLFYVLSGHGSIYRIKIRPSDYKMRRDVLGKIDMSFYDHKAMTMDYYNDGTNEGLIVGYSNAATGQAELYYINLVDDALTACKLGNIPGATAISGLTLASEQQYETHGITSEGSGVYKSSSQMLNVPFVPYLEPVKASELQNRADGALSSVTVRPASRETVTDSEQIVTVEVTARDVDGTDVAANNGLAIVTFDTEVLTLQDIQVGSDFRTVVEEDGSVLVAYADVSGYAAGEAVATLTFKVNETESTTVTVSHRQVNELVLDYTERLEVTFGHANTEIRDTKEATCTEAGYTGDVYCLDCGKLVKAGEVIPALGHSAGLVNMKEATCAEDGYTGDLVCTVCGEVLEKGEVIPASCPAERFTDVDTKQWYHEGVCYVLRKGFMVGKSETVFAADANLTRAELVLILYRMAGQPSVEGMNHSFQDVPADQWYTDAVIWAYNEEIVNGISDTVFAPNRAVTREQIAAIMYRCAGSMKVEQNHLKSYTDADSISTYAVDAMNWAVANGIITGTAMTTLAPRESALRAQIAVILMRYCEANN